MDVWLAAAERQRTHGDLVNLSAGQPSVGRPEPVRAAAAAALQANQLGYTVALGIPELRAAIARSYADRHGLAVDPDDVVVTTGSSGGFLLAFLACFDVGDRVRSPAPATLLPQHPVRARLRGRRAAVRAGDPVPADRRRCWPSSTRRVHGRDRRQPGQPDRHGDPARRTGRDRVLVRRHRRPADQRRGVPRPGVSRVRRRPAARGRPRGTPWW